MFNKNLISTDNFITPRFKTIKENYANKSCRISIYSKIVYKNTKALNLEQHIEDDWILEYSKEFLNIDLVYLDYKIKLIQKIIEDYYFFFHNRIFSKVVMFSLNNIFYKNPKIDYSTKILTGELIDIELMKSLPLSYEINLDIIDNKGGLKFYTENDRVILYLTDYLKNNYVKMFGLGTLLVSEKLDKEYFKNWLKTIHYSNEELKTLNFTEIQA